jgi:hypothetical protein
MRTRVRRSIRTPIRTARRPFKERWFGPDQGTIAAWEAGRDLAREEPDLAKRAVGGELVKLPWKGGTWRVEDPGAPPPKHPHTGSIWYLAMWQGLRGDDLDVRLDQPQPVPCSRTGLIVMFIPGTSARETGSRPRSRAKPTAARVSGRRSKSRASGTPDLFDVVKV